MNPFTATTLGKMAACRALGLWYWCDHPATGCIWAVDDRQQPCVVRWYRPNKRNANHTAALVTVGKPHPPYIGAPKNEWVYPTHDTGERVAFSPELDSATLV